VPERSNDIWNEVASAARGVVALVIGDRRANGYFDFSDRGLVGSFIAFLVVALLNTAVPLLLGVPGTSGTVFRAIATVIIVLALQIGAAALGLVGAGGELMFIATGIVIIIIMINIARLILTLTPWQIASFLVVQLVSGVIALFVVSAVFPLSPEQLAELTAGAGAATAP
jgi:hypothetical protein